jgi:hypothetical protein
MPITNDVDIGWRTQLSTEYRLWDIDLAPELDVGNVPNSATATLIDLLDGTSFAAGLAGSVVVSGTTVSQAVHSLVPGHNYRLVITTNVGSSVLTAAVLKLSCPF